MISFNKIVQKLSRKGGNVIFRDDIYELIDPEKKREYTSLVNKTIYNLRSRNIIKPIRNGIYIIPTTQDLELNDIDLVEKYYYKLVKKLISRDIGSNYYIPGQKALEIYNKNYSIPMQLIVINRKISKKIKFGDYEIVFKTVSGGGKNLFAKFFKLSRGVEFEGIRFRVSSLELALVESAIVQSGDDGLDIALIKSTLKKYKKVFDTSVFYEIREIKYIMAFNRLKELSRDIDYSLYLVFLDIIKVNGGLFIGEGLRGI